MRKKPTRALRMFKITRLVKIRRHEITQMAATLEPKLRREFMKAMEGVRRNVSLTKLTEILSSGSAADFENTILKNYEGNLTTSMLLLRRGFEEAGLVESKKVAPKVNDKGFVFNATNPATTEFINRYNFNLIQDLKSNTREGLRALFTSANKFGGHPRAQARVIREMIGVTRQQAATIYRATDRAKAAGASPKAVDKLVARMTVKALKVRALNIARTETIRALNHGQQAVWGQLAEQGLIDSRTAKREWIVTPDDRLCPICSTLEGAEAGLEQPFTTTVTHSETRAQSYTSLVPPIHPNCRCTIGLVFE